MKKGKKQADLTELFEQIARKEQRYPELLEFEERLPEHLRPVFREYSIDERKMVARLGEAFQGSELASGPLFDLMEKGTLLETHGSYLTQLDQLIEDGVHGREDQIRSTLSELAEASPLSV